jgi:hypothetical protein
MVVDQVISKIDETLPHQDQINFEDAAGYTKLYLGRTYENGENRLKRTHGTQNLH